MKFFETSKYHSFKKSTYIALRWIGIIGQLIAVYFVYFFLNSNFDFISGNISTENFDSKTGYPHGLIPVGIRYSALKKIYEQKQTSNTETGYKEFFMNDNLFKIKYLIPEIERDFSENLRLTIDYEEDFELAKKVIEELGNNFNFNNLLNLFQKKPELLKIVEPVIEKWKKNYNSNLTDTSLNQ